MPELAEVAVYAEDLVEWFSRANRRVTGIKLPNRRDGGGEVVPRSVQHIVKQMVRKRLSFSSQGKALLVAEWDMDGEWLLEIRLGMTGAFTLKKPSGKWKRHCFLEIETQSDSVFYIDHRRFSRFKEPTAEPTDHAIGGYNSQVGLWLAKTLQIPPGFDRRSRISWLLGSGDRTGVGNYMANEALGRAKLSPFEPFSDEREAARLLLRCGKIAKESFDHGGNSFGTGYFRLNGDEGTYSRKCLFYGNPGVPKTLVGGRPVFSHFPISPI